jgi:TolB protein
MRKEEVLSLASTALAILSAAALAVAAVTLAGGTRPAQAAFPGINARIVFERDRDGWRGPEAPEIYSIWFDGNNLKRLTNNTTKDTAPSWSADGRKIVYSGGDGRAPDSYKADIFVMKANGSDKTRITREREIAGASTADDLQPAFSPGGRQIVFVRNGPLADGHTLSNNDIYKIGTNGNNLTRLVNIPSLEYQYGCCPAWSPDGSKIVFYSEDYEDYRIDTIRPDGSNREFVTDGFAPNWSPDGSQIVFSRGGEIYKRDANGTEEKRLTTNEAYDSEPAFSPSGTRIVFSSDRDGDYDLYIKDADGTDLRRLTNQPGDDHVPDWQPAQ